jgi:hypothetical protein
MNTRVSHTAPCIQAQESIVNIYLSLHAARIVHAGMNVIWRAGRIESSRFLRYTARVKCIVHTVVAAQEYDQITLCYSG